MKWPLAPMESGANEHFIGSAIEASLSPVQVIAIEPQSASVDLMEE